MARTIVVFVLALAVGSGAAPSGASEAGAGIPLGPGLYRLHGTDPQLPTDDLEPLRSMLENATFVGLGESVHTNGSFSEMKHRIFGFLVEELGFRAFGFETPWVQAEKAREYVETCKGSSLDALRSLFGVWQSTETQALLEWMCQWNQEHPTDPVQFYGFDIQNIHDQNTTPLLDFLARLGHGEGDPLVEGIQACWIGWYNPNVIHYAQEPYDQCQAALAATAQLFDENEREIESATSREALAWARVHLVSAQSWQEQIFFHRTDASRSSSARDRGMAHVAVAIRDILFPPDTPGRGCRTAGDRSSGACRVGRAPRVRVALWAHNAHIMKNSTATDQTSTVDSMGTHLYQKFGVRYAALGLTAFDTYLDWWGVGLCGGPHHIWGLNPLEVLLHDEVGESALLLDFHDSATSLNPSPYYSIGGIYMSPYEQFDGLVYFREARAMDPTWVSRCP